MQEHFRDTIIPLVQKMYSDKILVFAGVIISILAIGNVINKLFLAFEPLQYHLFSYDKVLHLLAAVILVRSIFWIFKAANHPSTERSLILKSSFLTLLLYAILWEVFELFTFIILASPQFWLELYDVPLDIIYDVIGVLVSNLLGYKA